MLHSLNTFTQSIAAHGATFTYSITDNPPVRPPGLEGIDTLVSWVLWVVGAILFVLFIVGLVKASSARNNGRDSDVAAPVWPLVGALVLGASGTIWNALS